MQSVATRVFLATAALAIAAALFLVLQDEDDEPESAGGPAATPIEFRDGEPVGGVKEIEAAKGDPVRIEVTSDVPAEAHVHGYEIQTPVRAGQTPSLIAFGATIEGRFEVELHLLEHGEDAGDVEVAELHVVP